MSRTSPQVSPSLTAFDEMLALWSEHGHGMPDDGWKHTYRVKVVDLHTREDVFQPRQTEERKRDLEQHVEDLRELIQDGQPFSTKILIFPIAGKRYVLDGHCRLKALRAEGVDMCAVEPFTGDFHAALRESMRLNGEVKLSLARRERGEVAWRHVIFAVREREGASSETARSKPLSYRSLASLCGIGKDAIAAMVKVLTEGIPAHPSLTRDALENMSWAYVQWVRKHGLSDPAGFDRQKEIERVGRTLKTHLKRSIERSPAVLWPALNEAFGEEKAREVHESFCTSRPYADSTHDSGSDF